MLQKLLFRDLKKQRKYYSGKKKIHSIKSQVAVDKQTKKIISTSFCKGRKHDFRLFKESKTYIHNKIKVLTDTGCQGIKKLHNNSEHPIKKNKRKPLSKEDRLYNRDLSSGRVLNENVIGFIKRFKIVTDKYRNRRKRFGLRFNLLAAFCNFLLLI
jgi:hypothetical protein